MGNKKANRRRRQQTHRRDRISALSDGMSKPNLTCSECRAPNDPGATECWLCHRRDWRDESVSPATTTKPIAETPLLTMEMPVGETLLILLALAVVATGLVRFAPGLGIAFLILLVPAWAITEWRARRRAKPMSVHRKFAWIVGTTILLPVLLVLSLLIPLFALCTAVLF
jgi:hypothetical protein